MHTKSKFLSDISALGLDQNRPLLIHSSMKSIGETEGGGDTVIDAFLEYYGDNLLMFPAHTWSKINGNYNIFDPLTEPACVGILPNLFLKRPGVIRSLHPTHSIAAHGAKAAEFTSGEENCVTPCPRNGCWGKLYDYNAVIMFLGCTLETNTLLHGVEEWCEIPNRVSDWTEQLYIKIDDSYRSVLMHRHNSTVEDVSGKYIKMEKPFLEAGIARKGKFGDAEVYICEARGMADLTAEYLRRQPDFFAEF